MKFDGDPDLIKTVTNFYVRGEDGGGFAGIVEKGREKQGLNKKI